jgi:hypothetical protein
MISALESRFSVATGALGLTSLLLFFFGSRSFPFGHTVLFLSLILAASLLARIGAHQHTQAHDSHGVRLEWLAAGLATVVAVWSALSLVLVLLAVLAIITAGLGSIERLQVHPRTPRLDQLR